MGCGNSQVNQVEKKKKIDDKNKGETPNEEGKGQMVKKEDKINKKKGVMSQEEKGVRIEKDMYIKQVESKDIRDDYYLERQLAQGSYGDIRIVKHKKTNQSRAMKVIAKNKTSADQQAIFNEISILSKLDHPNIIKLYEYYQDKYAYYLIFELLLGGQLIEYIQLNNFLLEQDSAHIFQQLLSATNYCHQQNIAHLNLTPHNILLYQEEGAKPFIKIINWSHSRYFEKETIFSSNINDPSFKSPEEISLKYNYLSDVWSCGIIWFMMLIGSPPFYGVNRKKTIEAIKEFKICYWGEFSVKHDEQIKAIFKSIFVPQEQRKTCEQILQHQYFKDIFTETNSQEISEQLDAERQLRKKNFLSISGFQCNSKFYQAVVNYMGFYLVGDAERKQLSEDFQRIDVNKDGQLSKSEIKQGFQGFFIEDIGDIDKFLDELFENVDSNNNGFINYNEFISVAMDKMNMQQENKLKQAFSYFDSDSNGQITKQELIWSLSSQFNQDKNIEKMWQAIVDNGDKNKDGKISYTEFVEMLGDMNK